MTNSEEVQSTQSLFNLLFFTYVLRYYFSIALFQNLITAQ